MAGTSGTLVKSGTSCVSPSHWFAVQCKDVASSAQTERRGGAGPVRGLLGGKASPAAFVLVADTLPCCRRSRHRECVWRQVLDLDLVEGHARFWVMVLERDMP